MSIWCVERDARQTGVCVCQGLHLLFPYVTKRIVYLGSVDDIVTLLSSDYPYIQRMSKATQEQLNSFGMY